MHVARMDTSFDITRALKLSIRGLPRDWRHPSGYPRRTWLCTLEADLQPHNLGMHGGLLRTEVVGSILWKQLHSSSGHARDGDDDDR